MNLQVIPNPISWPCPCCGHQVFNEGPGSDEICPVCFWQDDLVGMLNPFESVGPNKVPLIVAQNNFEVFGLCDSRYSNIKNRLAPRGKFAIEEGWRPINPASDRFITNEVPEEIERTYYWRSNYWLKGDAEV